MSRNLIGSVLESLLLTAILLCRPLDVTQSGKVIAWDVASNTPEWNRALKVWGARQGCTSSPSGCIQFAKELARKYHVKVFLSIRLNDSTPEYAIQFSQLSLSVPGFGRSGCR